MSITKLGSIDHLSRITVGCYVYAYEISYNKDLCKVQTNAFFTMYEAPLGAGMV